MELLANRHEYVDVRGVYPLYVNGCFAITLEGKDRSITVEDARVVAQFLLSVR